MNRELVYLAALLHDIGKFYQRADDGGVRQSTLLNDEVKNKEKELCRINHEGKTTNKHILWTYQFIQFEAKKVFENVFKKEIETLARISSRHHVYQTTDFLEKIIQEADKLASAGERVANEGETIEYGKEWDKFKLVRMRSVFESINKEEIKEYLDTEERFKYEYFLPIKRTLLELEDIEKTHQYFPTKEVKDTQRDEYKLLWNEFVSEFTTINTQNFKALASMTLALLEKYTVSVPSSTISLPDVSLYDHLKVTAALAICLYDYYEVNREDNNNTYLKVGEEPILLIGGDISGVQNFMYDIVSSKAAKNLKGRSFYIELITQSIVQSLLDDLKLFEANIIFASGAHFYIVAPNIKNTEDKLNEFEKKINKWLYKNHDSALTITLGTTPLSKKELLNSPKKLLKEAFERIKNVEIPLKKKRKFSFIIENNFDEFFTPKNISGEELRDIITGEEIINEEKFTFIEDNKEITTAEYHKNNSYATYQIVKLKTKLQINLGKELKQTKFIVVIKRTEDNDNTFYYGQDTIFTIIDYNYYLVTDNIKLIEVIKELKKKDKTITKVIAFNNLDFLINSIDIEDSFVPFPSTFYYYGGNDYPITVIEKDNKYERVPKTFSEMTGAKDDDRVYPPNTFVESNYKRLGVIKLDMDNLGTIFSEGFSDKQYTFSRLYTLSRNIDYYFKGFINVIWKNNAKFKQYSQIIYAGGDDLMLVGRWDVVQELAIKIQEYFKKFTCHNSTLSISGSSVAVTHKFPILKATDFAKNDESKAKKHSVKSKETKNTSEKVLKYTTEKNAISIFGVPLRWDTEFMLVYTLKTEILDLMQNRSNEFPKSVFTNLQYFEEIKSIQKEKKQTESWRWHLAYDIARTKERYKNEIYIKEFLDRIKINIFCNRDVNNPNWLTNYDYLSLLNIAIRWAELEYRTLKGVKV